MDHAYHFLYIFALLYYFEGLPPFAWQKKKQAGLRPSSTKLRETKVCPRPSGTRNQVGGTSSFRYELERNKGLSSPIWYEESS